MDPLTGALIGVAKSELFDRPEQERQEKMRAEEIRFSPWLNVAPRQVGAAPSTGNAALQGGFAGLDYQQRLAQNNPVDPSKQTQESQAVANSLKIVPWDADYARFQEAAELMHQGGRRHG